MNQDHDSSFMAEYIKELLPVDVLRTIFRFLREPRTSIITIKANDRWLPSRPAAFMIGVIGLIMILVTLFQVRISQVTWYAVYLDFPEEQKVEFLTAFNIRELATKKHFRKEDADPGKSPMSDSIKAKVGSLDPTQISLFLANSNPVLASTFALNARFHDRMSSCLSYILPLTLLASALMAAFIIHELLKVPGTTHRMMLHVTIYWNGVWSLLSVLVIGLRQSLWPRDHTVLTGLVLFLETTIFLISIGHFIWLIGLLYNRSIRRRVFSCLLGLIVGFLPIPPSIALAYLLTKVME